MSTPEPKDNSISVEGRYFDLDKFEEVTEKTTVEFTPPTSLQDAMARLNNEEARVVELIASALRTQVVNTEKRRISELGVGKDTVLKVARGFYDMPQFTDLSRSEKRAAIFALMKESPVIMDAIRKAAKEEPVDPTNDEDDD